MKNKVALEKPKADDKFDLALRMLTDARAIIDDKRNWTKLSFYTGPNGYRVYSVCEATSFCLMGAVTSASEKLKKAWGVAHTVALQYLLKSLSNVDTSRTTLTGYNDDPATTHENILTLLDHAIAALTKTIEDNNHVSVSDYREAPARRQGPYRRP